MRNELDHISGLAVTEKGADDLLDFSVNTNLLGVPAAVSDGLLQIRDAVSGYPDPGCSFLTKLLAEKHHVPENTVLFGNGADDLLYRLAFAGKPKKAMIIEPTYEEYARAFQKTGCELIRYRLSPERDFEMDQEVLSVVQSDLDLVLLCNPNNPTGRLADPEIVGQLAEKCLQNDILLVIDECFMEFLPDWEHYSLKQQAASSQNLIIIDAFTKTYSLAGFRLGYCITGNQMLLAEMKLQGPDYGVSVPAQFAGVCALMDEGYLPETYLLLEKERKWLYTELCSLNLRVIPSSVNYFLLQDPRTDIYKRLLEKGIKTRNCSLFYGLDGTYCRMAVRQHWENERFVAALQEILFGERP